MPDMRVDKRQEVAFAKGKSYLGNYDFVSGKDGYWISQDFYESHDFNVILLKVFFKYYPKQLESFIIENDFNLGEFSKILRTIRDISLVKYIAQERDGFINEIILPTDENGDILDEGEWDKWCTQNLKATDIIFVKYS